MYYKNWGPGGPNLVIWQFSNTWIKGVGELWPLENIARFFYITWLNSSYWIWSVWSDCELEAIHGLRYTKRSPMSWVVVIPKEGWPRMAAPTLLLVWHRKKKIWIFFFKILKSRCYTKRRAGVAPVWHRLRTLGTFSRNAGHIAIGSKVCGLTVNWKPIMWI